MATTHTREPLLKITDLELWTTAQLAGVLGVSRRTIYELKHREQLPKQVVLPTEAGRPVYRSAEIRAWIRAGCPDPTNWRWNETLPEKLDALIARKTIEIKGLDEQINRLRRELDELDAKYAKAT